MKILEEQFICINLDEADQLPDVAGVYTIICTKDNKHYVKDVGMSSNINERISDHDRRDCWDKNCSGVLRICYRDMTGYTDEQIRGFESQIRDKYNPPCGDK
ncbi:GIY-YIG nuclease family protein [Halobacteriovorax sp. XZX-3]|uniref:GIY-YIG nuclease family protein n=1 Tax=unclassified Halobacteriovorax TaxID=2639665 RepID=UPI000CD0A127|nr:GIY-YIG nuclease family protein [Halobacteriovorax sp. DA5]POB14715.1 hypothetical protein C0Z22_06360 [Halobacteriovorax sp. DA5]